MRRKTLVTLVSVVVLALAAALVASPAVAEGHRGRIVITGGLGFGPRFFDPFWAPYPSRPVSL